MTDPAKFRHLRPALNDFISDCVKSMFSVECVDEDRVRQAIATLYAQMNLSVPSIVFLESPWQLEKALAYVGATNLTRINASGHIWRSFQCIEPKFLSSESEELLSYCRSFINGPVRMPISRARRETGLVGIADHLRSMALPPISMDESYALFERLADVMRAKFRNADGTSRFKRPPKQIEGRWSDWDINPVDFVFAWDLIAQTAFYRFAIEYVEVPISTTEREAVTPVFDLSESGHAFHLFKELCLCSLRPDQCQTDPQGRLHSVRTPALSYRDGIKSFAWHGVRVPEYAVSDRIPWSAGHWEANAEVMKVLVERFGEENFLKKIGAMIVDRSEFGTLYWQFSTSVARAFLAVKNSTPELDGTVKTYFLCVPPDMVSAKQAVAWTFGLEEEEYEPSVQT